MKRAAAARLCGLLVAAAAAAQAAFEPAGNVLIVREMHNGAEMTLTGGFVVRIQWIANDTVRFQTTRGQEAARTLPSVLTEPSRPLGVELVDLNDVALITAPNGGTVSVLKRPFRWFLTRPGGALVAAEASPGLSVDQASGTALTRLTTVQGDGFYGLGMNGGDPNRRGQRIWLRNTALAGFDETTTPLHLNFPLLYAIAPGRSMGVFVDSAAGPVMDVDTSADGTILLAGSTGGLDYYVLTGPQPAQVANAYARLTGFQPLPPRWALGYHHSRFGFRSQEELLAIAREFRNLEVPLDALYLDLDYMNRLQSFTWDPAAFPSPQAMNATLRSMGVRTVNIVEPCLLTADPLYLQMALNEMLLLGPDRLPFTTDLFLGRVGWVDFGFERARNWYKERLAAFLQSGVEGIWNDLNEPADNYMPETVVHRADGRQFSHVAVRNLYPVQQTSLSYETLRQARPNRRPFVLSRAGSPGIQRFAANWSGDTNTSFDSLRTSVRMTVSMGLSGQNLFGHDVGGFLGTPSPELMVRWMQFGAFTPLFRTHSNRDTAPREPWAYGDPYLSYLREAIRERYRILPYLYTLFETASRTGEPVVAPTAYYFPADPATRQQGYDYMLGPAMLVAPIVETGVDQRLVYLPAGQDWADYYTGEVHRGGQILKAPVTIERIPVFVRAGAVLPKGAGDVRGTDEAAQRPMSMDFYPGAPGGGFEVYEDDGESFAYERGAWRRTAWLWRTQTDGSVRIDARRSGSLPGRQGWTLRLLRQPQAPEQVQVNGAAWPRLDNRAKLAEPGARGWFFDPETRELFLQVEENGGLAVAIGWPQ